MLEISAPPCELPFELESLSRAVRYQSWVHARVLPSLGRRILEVGAGIGSMSQWLPVRERLLLSEMDEALFVRLQRRMSELHPDDHAVECVHLPLGTELLARAKAERIDTVVSFNVLEHIDDDEGAFASLFETLRAGTGTRRLVTFVPAHPFAYGELDRAFGHFRRYNHGSLKQLWRKLAPDFEVSFRYLNLPGLLAWCLMGRVLKKSTIGESSVNNFERLLPIIRPVDDLLHDALKIPMGQSLLAIATKT